MPRRERASAPLTAAARRVFAELNEHDPAMLAWIIILGVGAAVQLGGGNVTRARMREYLTPGQYRAWRRTPGGQRATAAAAKGGA